MGTPPVIIVYTLANRKRICVEVSIEVKELLEQSDRQIRSQRRQNRRYLDFMESVSDLGATLTLPQEDIADLLIKLESFKRLYEAVNELSEKQRRRLLLHFVDNLSYSKIADLEGVNQGTVGHSIRCALSQLKKYLGG